MAISGHDAHVVYCIQNQMRKKWNHIKQASYYKRLNHIRFCHSPPKTTMTLNDKSVLTLTELVEKSVLPSSMNEKLPRSRWKLPLDSQP